MIEKSTISFLRNLGKNNNREWFRAHRDEYEESRRNMLDATLYLISEIEKFDATVSGVDPEECLFRIHRDTRFSREKTPYKTNFGSFIKGGGRKTAGAGYYLHISPGEHMVAGGIYMPPPEALLAIRRAIAADAGPLKKILASPQFKKEFGSLAGETLATAPRGFPRDHREIELLKHKHYMVVKEIPEKEVLDPGFLRQCVRTFKAMSGLNGYINRLL